MAQFSFFWCVFIFSSFSCCFPPPLSFKMLYIKSKNVFYDNTLYNVMLFCLECWKYYTSSTPACRRWLPEGHLTRHQTIQILLDCLNPKQFLASEPLPVHDDFLPLPQLPSPLKLWWGNNGFRAIQFPFHQDIIAFIWSTKSLDH